MRRVQPDTPLVLLTHDEKAALAAVRAGGFTTIVLKPIEKDQLLATGAPGRLTIAAWCSRNAMYGKIWSRW